MMQREALRPTSKRRVCELLHHTGAQYSTGAYTSARVDVLNEFVKCDTRKNVIILTTKAPFTVVVSDELNPP